MAVKSTLKDETLRDGVEGPVVGGVVGAVVAEGDVVGEVVGVDFPPQAAPTRAIVTASDTDPTKEYLLRFMPLLLVPEP